MLEHFKSSNDIELAIRASWVGKRIIGGDMIEATRTKLISEMTRTRAVIQNSEMREPSKTSHHGCRLTFRAAAGVFGIHLDLIFVVDESSKFLRCPIVKQSGKQKATGRTAKIRDGDVGRPEGLQFWRATNLIKVHHVKKVGMAATYFAGNRLPISAV